MNSAADCFTIRRSAAIGVAMPTLPLPVSGSPETAPVPVAVAVLVITVLGGRPALTVTSKVTVVVWPAASVPVVDGQTYTFSNAVGMPVKIRTMVLAQVPSDELEVAGVIADKGCTAQLDMLANLAQSSQVGG